MASDDLPGINRKNIAGWLTERSEVTGEIRFDGVTHGRSNLTYKLEDEAGRKWILRRPPTGHILASAHDMGREHKIISALGPSNVPVPGIVGMCVDEIVTGAPFFVMDFVEGSIIKDRVDAQSFSADERRMQSVSLVELSLIHI